ncbi:hypothetical protein [Brachybacterium saurashtrense]|uniref:Di-and tripeptidase n=1 Tax=Brachybacterium saurashtrense TaxID=556288 RepID=A0A345YLK9_9MICO|nr:hypothetical protein [Brachybacterium saurashtrense]AXK44811.1 hypothetical protein DWV08_03635 [Brachybacterium saurashtrense]RRR23423.1 hypothetical protein DXU92_08770 [Brachybacterium saurashtrense]
MAQSDPTTPPRGEHAPHEDLSAGEQIDERWLSVVDGALKAQAPLARSYVTRLRAAHPEETERQLLQRVTSRFVAVTMVTGAGIGGVAALPGLGTAAALGLTVGEGVTFAEACAFLTLSAAEIHGVDMADRSTRRLVLMAVLSGERGTEIIAKAMGTHGLQWNAVLGGGGGFLPGLISKQVSRYVRRRVVSRTGKLWFARLLPFGIGAVIGAVGARVVARSVVEAMEEIFSHRTVLEGAPRGGALEG